MCGIAGIFRLTGRPTAEDAAAVLRMMDAQLHRGPDDWGLLVPASLATDSGSRALRQAGGREHLRTYSDAGSGPGAILGTRRLSILDLSEQGRMPMGSADGRLWVTHNGEIYNYRELRAELEGHGEPFHSATDTEAILRGYALWDEAVVPRLRGMFAFALFEAAPRPRLLLARDHLGIKPLYYHQDRERLIFASEVRALLRSGMVPDEADPEALVRFLQLGSVPVPKTTVKDVVALPAAHCLTVDAQGAALRRYWDLSAYAWRRSDPAAAVSPVEAAATTRALLEESTRLQLVSDVPLGVFLSGGIDSSGLVALASQFRGASLSTLSIAFDEPAYSEAPYARLVAERYGTAHREVVLHARDLFDGMPRIFAAMDEPTVDGVNTYFVSEAARQAGLTVVLSGTGGDEVFFGYGHFRRNKALDRLRRLLGAVPVQARRALIKAALRGGAALGRPGLDRLQYLEQPSLDNVYLLVRGVFSPRQIQDLLGIGQAEFEAWGPALPPVDDARGGGMLDAFGTLEFTHYLQNQLLKDADVMSMAHSIETRVPYLDHRLVEYVMGLPPALKLDRDRPKPLLLEALGDALPREVWDRPKMGFTFPFELWMRQRSADVEAASASTKWLQRSAVEAIWREYKAGQVHWSRPWTLVVLAAFEACRKTVATA
jgi:asparagine synthase (glutamine-hydrolysing)